MTDDQVLDLAKKSEVASYAISLRFQRPLDRKRPAFSQAEYLMNALGRGAFPLQALLSSAAPGVSRPSSSE